MGDPHFIGLEPITPTVHDAPGPASGPTAATKTSPSISAAPAFPVSGIGATGMMATLHSTPSITSPASAGEQAIGSSGQTASLHQQASLTLQPSITSTSSSLGAPPEQKSALKQRLVRSFEMTEPTDRTHVSSSSRSDSVSSGSDTKRLSFLAGSGAGAGASSEMFIWDENQTGPDRGKHPLASIFTKKGAEAHPHGFSNKKFDDITGWWGDMVDLDDAMGA